MKVRGRSNILVYSTLLFVALLLLNFDKVLTPVAYQFPELKLFPEMPTTDNPPTIEGVALGRFLFYDTILSANKTFSCASCHKQEVAFSDSPRRFSVGVNGDLLRRNTMPLYNLAWYPSFHWGGKAESIESQALLPVRAHDEMNLDWSIAVERVRSSDFYRPKFRAAFGDSEIDSLLICKAIAQFERTLISNNSKYDQVIRGEARFTSDEFAGFEIMNDQTKGDCLHCHTTDADALGTTTLFSNNGLTAAAKPSDYPDKGLAEITGEASDVGRFRIPSLRNIAVTAPYMHDGRFQTLEEVIDFYSDHVENSFNVDSKMGFARQGGAKLSEDEKRKIIVFLHTLTDSVFLTNPEFSNPFRENNQR